MRVVIFFLLGIPVLSAVSIPCDKHVLLQSRSPVTGGNPVVSNESPFMIAIEKDGYVSCGGTLIGPTAVLTARGCVDSSRTDFTVRAGTTVFASRGKLQGGRVARVSRIVYHEQWDAAILLLEEKITSFKDRHRIKPAKLPDPGYEPYQLTPSTAFGWGYTMHPENPNDDLPIQPSDAMQLMKTSLFSIPRIRCEQDIERRIGLDLICLRGHRLGQGMCIGDTGSPAVLGQNTVIGISATGNRYCGKTETPNLFVSVGVLVDWIYDVVPALRPRNLRTAKALEPICHFLLCQPSALTQVT